MAANGPTCPRKRLVGPGWERVRGNEKSGPVREAALLTQRLVDKES